MATTTVFYNGVRDIIFEVEDKAGNPASVRVHGSGHAIAGNTPQVLPGIGAYGITTVDADLWAVVEKKYSDMDIFKKGFIRAGASEKAKAAAKEEVSAQDNGQSPESVAKKAKKGKK